MVRLISIALATLSALSVTSASALLPRASWEWSNCGLSSDALQIDSITVSPDPPKPGSELTLTVKGTVQEEIQEGAYIDVTVKLGLIKLLHKSFNFCEELRAGNSTVQCPIQNGPVTLTEVYKIPREVPPAKLKIEARGYTAADDDLLCANFNFDFLPSLP